MRAYQLYRANPRLSGQVKWDLSIDRDKSGGLYVGDLHLTPISPSIPFNYGKDDDTSILLYPHQYNLRKFYEEIGGYFYDTSTISSLSTSWPLVLPSSHPQSIPLHDNTLESGLNRSSRSLTGHQMEFLVPLWVEDLDGGKIGFRIAVSLPGEGGQKTAVASREIVLKEDKKGKFHDRFASYLDDYIKYIGLDSSDNRFAGVLNGEDVINIDLKDYKARINGLEAGSGNVVSKDINSLASNLLSRERPMMEFDDMIIGSFEKNGLIARQALNFNLCFDIDDIIGTAGAAAMFKGMGMIVSVDAFIEKDEARTFLEHKDYYYNYDYIPLEDVSLDSHPVLSEDQTNALGYLQDNKYVNFTNVNKISPSIIHWSLGDNNDYVFNLYKGWGSYVCSTDETGRIKVSYNTSQMAGSPDMNTGSFDPDVTGSMGWAKVYSKNISVSDINRIEVSLVSRPPQERIRYIESFSTRLPDPDGTVWMNNIKYTPDEPDQEMRSGENNNIYITLALADPIRFTEIDNTAGQEDNKIATPIGNTDSDDNGLRILKIYNLLYIIVCNSEMKDNLSFPNFYKILSGLKTDGYPSDYKYIFETLKSLFDHVSIPDTFTFTKSLIISHAPSPSIKSTEVEYYKDNDVNVSLYRYDGKIKPTFIDVTGGRDDVYNYIYYKRAEMKDDLTVGKSGEVFSTYSSSGYDPQFPSIGYYSIKKERLSSYDMNPGLLKEIIIPGNNNGSKIEDQPYEYKWFNDGVILNLIPEISFQAAIDRKTDRIVTDEIKEKIAQLYGIEGNKEKIDYIYSLYNIKYTYDYEDGDKSTSNKLNSYTYNIQMKLK